MSAVLLQSESPSSLQSWSVIAGNPPMAARMLDFDVAAADPIALSPVDSAGHLPRGA